MEQKLQELTEKIYAEGVEKGDKKAQEIIKEAGDRAATLVSDANKEADSIISNAKKEAETIKRDIEIRVKLSGKEAISAIRQKIQDVISAKAADKKAGKTSKDDSTVKTFLKAIISKWDPNDPGTPQVEILLPAHMQKELEDYFKSRSQGTMGEGLQVGFDKNIKGGFQIGLKDNAFKISLTDEGFTEFFIRFLRPNTRKFLFND
jgi:V/A-type H+-transporting ATPase subunit E